MSVSYNEKLLLSQALQGGYPISRVRRNRRMLSLCAKFALVGAVALVFTGIAIAAPAVGTGPWADNPAGGAADPIATSADDDLIQLAHHGRGSHPNQSNSGGGFGNTGLGNQGRGNSPVVGNALGPRAGGGGNGGGNGGGFFGGGGPGGDGDDPWILVRGVPGAEDGGTQGPGALGLAPGQITCALGENGLAIRSDGQVLFAQFFAEQTGLGFGKDGCEEVVNYPDTEDMAGK